MGEHVVLSVLDSLIAPATLQPQHDGDGDALGSLIEGATHVNDVGECDTLEEEEEEEEDKEEEDLIKMVECRICQEDDTLQNLDIPCACSGTLKPFKPGYTANSPVCHPGDTSIDISDDWATTRNPLDLHNARLLAIAAVDYQVPETEHEDYVNAGTGGTTLWHSVGLILMALLLLRHAAPLFNADVEKAIAYFYFFFLGAAAVILPCYLVAWIIRIIQHQRQRQVTTLCLF
ncbi:hypothetical protein D0Y65_015165 [Glycine soja]|uniref:RING-CH-type domain-containing protein n=1 Tax=Glycine soja TaxID=3848 RepID=A0A445KC33_GLYSO|nr:hypothetical protein D0Y65_015165 [Glycine soja]